MSPEELKIPPTTYNWEFAGRYLEEEGGFTGWYGLLGDKDDEGCLVGGLEHEFYCPIYWE